jgi:hypothetical protein
LIRLRIVKGGAERTIIASSDETPASGINHASRDCVRYRPIDGCDRVLGFARDMVRTVYHDIATLQARRIPIEGAPGIGYVLRRGLELPPLMFTEDEAEAIAVGVRMLARTGDPGLQKAAERVLSKVTPAVPDLLREYLRATPGYFSKSGAPVRRNSSLLTRRLEEAVTSELVSESRNSLLAGKIQGNSSILASDVQIPH